MLKSLSEIRALSPENVLDYATFLAANHGWNRIRATNVLNAIREAPEEVIPASDSVLLYLMEFLICNYWDENRISVQINVKFESKIFCTEEDIVLFYWEFSGDIHTIVINKSDMNFLSGICSNLYSGANLDDVVSEKFGTPNVAVPSLDYLDENIREYMRNLGIVYIPKYLATNSESLEVKENTSRFSGAMWYEAIQGKVVTLAGLGGIGSYVGFLLARMNPKSIFAYDDDRVETVNMSGQFYGRTDIGNYKADALASAVKNYADYNSMFSINQRFTEETSASDIMICGFDNMEARKLFFSKWALHVKDKSPEDKKHCLFIDGRLAAEDLQVICIAGDNTPGIIRYEQEFLFIDEEADETVCSYKQTTYMANMIGSIIVNLFTNFVANELVGAPIRSLPFFTAYDGISMRIKNE